MTKSITTSVRTFIYQLFKSRRKENDDCMMKEENLMITYYWNEINHYLKYHILTCPRWETSDCNRDANALHFTFFAQVDVVRIVLFYCYMFFESFEKWTSTISFCISILLLFRFSYHALTGKVGCLFAFWIDRNRL